MVPRSCFALHSAPLLGRIALPFDAMYLAFPGYLFSGASSLGVRSEVLALDITEHSTYHLAVEFQGPGAKFWY